jgi:uncharacterized protein DUF4389
MIVMTAATTYPVRVDATLDGEPSRWLWLVKWLLAIPHYLVLVFLWLAFAVLSVVAFVAILVTGRYPLSIFEFNVGVLRWTWRVHYYSYGALGTDRYPPFTLADDPDFPAHFDVAHPERLSRGLVLVKWWLLALPHYVVVGLFVGGTVWGVWRVEQASNGPATFGGLIGVLVLFVAVALLFTGRYPRGLFDLLLGANRWVLRVAAYAALMTDRYPPFRMDLGGTDPADTRVVPPPTDTPPPDVPPGGGGWTAGRIASVVIGAVVGLVAVGSITGGATALWANGTMRTADGFVSASAVTVHSGGYAVASDDIDLSGLGGLSGVVGDVRLRVTPAGDNGSMFVGIAPTAAADAYLAGVARSTVTRLDGRDTATVSLPGGPPATPPSAATIWAQSSSGAGPRTVTWVPADGRWTVVVMNANGSADVTANVVAGATAPALVPVGAGLLAFGIVALAGAVLLIAIPVQRASR